MTECLLPKMSLKNICSIARSWTLEDYRLHTCSDGSHAHLTRAQVQEKDKQGLVVWLMRGETRRESSVVWVLSNAHPGPSTKSFCATEPINAGLSNRVGEQLAIGVYTRQDWALTMLAQVNLRREGSFEPISAE